jgi:hypothetical protein
VLYEPVIARGSREMGGREGEKSEGQGYHAQGVGDGQGWNSQKVCKVCDFQHVSEKEWWLRRRSGSFLYSSYLVAQGKTLGSGGGRGGRWDKMG